MPDNSVNFHGDVGIRRRHILHKRHGAACPGDFILRERMLWELAATSILRCTNTTRRL